MQIEIGFQPSCSEAVFRFHTIDSAQIQQILQGIADTIKKTYANEKDPWVKEATKVSPEKIVKDRLYNTLGSNDKTKKALAEMPLADLTLENLEPFIQNSPFDSEYTRQHVLRILTLKEKCPINDEVPLLKDPKDYERTFLFNCAGLGDNESIIKVNKKKGCFTLNIGNNDIQGSWPEVVKAMGIKVEEAEYSKALQKIARDCCCGITYFDGYEGLIKDKKTKPGKQKA